MNLFLELFIEFFKAGLFAIGGGLATLPFLYDIAQNYDWLPIEKMPNMIAISESTPGPLGINMATYAGFTSGGILGSLLATFALVLPSFIIIIIVYQFLQRFRESKLVQSAFEGLRPAVTGLIAAACWQVIKISLFHFENFISWNTWYQVIDIKAVILFAILLFLILKFKKHPIFYIAGAAVVGMVFKF